MNATVSQYTPVSKYNTPQIQNKYILLTKICRVRDELVNLSFVYKALDEKKVISCPHFYISTSEEAVKGKMEFTVYIKYMFLFNK